MTTRLSVAQLTKCFPGVRALDQLSFILKAGEVHALCGENGAGKSTLIKCICGIWPSHSFDGSLSIDGQPVNFQNVADSEEAGIAVIFQELSLVEEMTVAENIFLGCEPRAGWLIDWPAMNVNCRELLNRYDIHLPPNQPVKQLSIGQKQQVEIAKALAKRPRILLLDEPTSALTDKETASLMRIIQTLKQDNISCIYISHKLDEVLEIADTITVLRDGQSIDSKPRDRWTAKSIIKAMVGRSIEDLYPAPNPSKGKTILVVKNLTTDRLTQIDFNVRSGEVLGIGGLMGAGRTELLTHLFSGAGQRIAGEVVFDGRPHAPTSAQASILRGIAMVTEDRKYSGLVLNESIAFNLSLASLHKFCSLGIVNAYQEMSENQRYASQLQIKAPSLSVATNRLSGGNQQKVVLGKSLMTLPKIILLDEPTRGIDVGAKVEVYQLIRQLAEQGKAVILVSSEMPELLGMSDRILILSQGRVADEFRRGECTQEKLLQSAMKFN